MLEWLGLDMELVKEIVKQVPHLGVLAWLVSRFITAQRESNSDSKASIKEVNDSCHAFQREMSAQVGGIIKENTQALARVESLLDDFSRVEPEGSS